jgi:hypothetical protein
VEDLGVDVEGGVVKTLDGCPVGGGERRCAVPGVGCCRRRVLRRAPGGGARPARAGKDLAVLAVMPLSGAQLSDALEWVAGEILPKL